ncbi:MAG: shikimate kinase [Planctomycetota bacterium]|nr:shikimate kinase [Planctomycetota bacterium]
MNRPSTASFTNQSIGRGVIVIGMRGVGKTTVGRAVADRLATEFIDIDAVALGSSTHSSVADFFAAEGESAWRTAEARALSNTVAAAVRPTVVSIGGGLPMSDGGNAAIHEARANGWTIVWLDATVDVIAHRIAHDITVRPALTGPSVIDELSALDAARRPTYATLSSVRVDASGSIESVVDSVVSSLTP